MPLHPLDIPPRPVDTSPYLQWSGAVPPPHLSDIPHYGADVKPALETGWPTLETPPPPSRHPNPPSTRLAQPCRPPTSPTRYLVAHSRHPSPPSTRPAPPSRHLPSPHPSLRASPQWAEVAPPRPRFARTILKSPNSTDTTPMTLGGIHKRQGGHGSKRCGNNTCCFLTRALFWVQVDSLRSNKRHS